jgi:hypothetical protein
MTDRQEAYQNMTEAAVGVMDGNNGLWNTNPLISGIVASIKATMTSINTATGTQQQPATGATKSEHALWLIAGEKADHVCFGLKAYYTNGNDMVNFDMVNFAISAFLYCSKLTAVDRMQRIHDKAAAIPISSLVNYNVTASDITDLQTDINNFAASQPLRTIMKAGTKTATTNLTPLFKTQRAQMKLLDMYMGTMKQAHADFVSTFTNARKIINLGKTQMAEELHLMPNHFEVIFGQKFLEGDTFTIRNHSDMAKIRVFLSDSSNMPDATAGVEIAAKMEIKLTIPTGFKMPFGHSLIVLNEATMDDAQVTVVLAHGKSHSKAGNETATKLK